MNKLRGKVALVTGASTAIGAACAKALTQAGCHVALMAHERKALDETVESIRIEGGLARAYPCNMSDASTVAEVLKSIEAEMGPLSILVNNAELGTFKPLDRMRLEEVMLAMNLPVGTALAACHSVVLGMIARGEGQIINLTSPASYLPLPFMVPYAANHHAMLGLSISLREELEHHGIGVSLLCISKIDASHFGRDDNDSRWTPRIFSLFPTLRAELFGEQLLRVIGGNPREHIFPLSLRALIRLYQLAPRFNLWLLDKLGLLQPALS